MARMRSAYWPGSSLLAGKLKRPSLSLTTVMVMVEPAFLALTSTPSIAPSSAERDLPAQRDGLRRRGGHRQECECKQA